MTPIRRRLLLAVLLGGLAVATWLLRWQIGTNAFVIVEPSVRRWAVTEVGRLSDSVYRLSMSTIRVAADNRRVAFDSLHLTTDTLANRRRDTPLPIIDLRFGDCALTGVDAQRLASGGGLRAASVSCNRLLATIRVPPGVVRDTTGGAFLTLRDTLRLPVTLPSIDFDRLHFPHVQLELRIDQASGDQSSLDLEHLAVQLDSVSYDPRVPVRLRPTLLSRDVVIRLADAEGKRGNDHLTLGGLRASLTDGTLLLNDLAWTPVAGARADSLGVAGMQLDSLALRGVDWGAALTNGDVRVRSITTTGVRVTTRAGGKPAAATAASSAPWTLGSFLAALHRRVAIDSFVALDIEVEHLRQRATTRGRWLQFTGLRSGMGAPLGGVVTPAAGLRLQAAGLVHAWKDQRASVDSIDLNLPGGSIDAGAIHFGSTGTDGQFAARRRWRSDRVTLDVTTLRVRRLDADAWIRTGAYHAGLLRLDGARLDVFSDRQLPGNPDPSVHRSPQAWLRTVPVQLRIDSTALRGRIRYRERGAESGMIGELRFEDVAIAIGRFATGTRPGAAPITTMATGRLMGEAPLQVTATLHRSPGFDMNWSGRLGAMPAAALNPMLVAVTDFAFAEGHLDWIDFEVETHDGLSSGVVRPRYRDLKVSTPGVARRGALGGVRRAIAGMVANAFVVRGNNRAAGNGPTIDGRISHGWTPDETLIKHAWAALRDGLRQVLTP